MVESFGGGLRELIGERFGNLRREETGVCVGELVDLRVHRCQHVGMSVTEAGDSCAAAGIDVLFAALIGYVDARCADCG